MITPHTRRTAEHPASVPASRWPLWLAMLCAGLALTSPATAEPNPATHSWTVCPAEDTWRGCQFHGYQGLQEAVEEASSGDAIVIRAGVYSPTSFLDVQHGHLTIRGALLIERKAIRLVGQSGAILDGSRGAPSCAIVIHEGKARISGLEIRDFRVEDGEDDLYDGHGIFAVDAEIELADVLLQRIEKMSVSLLGSSKGLLKRIRILDGHVGIWVDETATLDLRNSLVRNNDSAGVAAYGQSTGQILNSVLEGNLDDGIYADDSARLRLRNSVLINNEPYAVRAERDGSVDVDYVVLHGNHNAFFDSENNDLLQRGEHINFFEPGLDAHYRLDPAIASDRGDPALRDPDGSVSDIGLYGGTDAPNDFCPTRPACE